MIQEYALNFVSRTIYFLRGFLAIVIGLSITLVIAISSTERLPTLIFFVIDALITILLFYLSKNWHKGRLLIHFREKEMSIESHLPLLKQSRKFVFHWNELSDLSCSDTQYFRILVVKDSKKKVAFAMDYGDAATQFEQKLNNQLAKLDKTESIIISQKPSIYATKLGIGIAIILGLIMIAWPLLAWINQREFQIGVALIFYSGAGFLIYMVYRTRKNKVSE